MKIFFATFYNKKRARWVINSQKGESDELKSLMFETERLRCDTNSYEISWIESEHLEDDDEDDAEILPAWPAIWYNGFWRV